MRCSCGTETGDLSETKWQGKKHDKKVTWKPENMTKQNLKRDRSQLLVYLSSLKETNLFKPYISDYLFLKFWKLNPQISWNLM